MGKFKKGHVTWNKTHGLSRSKTYNIWCLMKRRCLNLDVKDYKNYGGRGIKVCDRWLQSFKNFYDDLGECPEGYSIERIDVNGNYEPNNCKWIPLNEQGWNTRKVRFLEFNGKKQSVLKWSKELNIPYRLIINRLNLGWHIKKALETKSQKILINGHSLRLETIKRGLNYDFVRSRISKYGWSIEKALNTPPLWKRS